MADDRLPRAARAGDAARTPHGGDDDGGDDERCDRCPHDEVGRSATGSVNVLVNRRRALRVGDKGVHETCQGTGEWEATHGAPRVLINNKRAHRLGDDVRYRGGWTGHTVQGSPDVLIGNYVAGERAEQFAASMVLTDMPGPAGAPLMHAPWRLLLDGRMVERGETDASGRLQLTTRLLPNRAYELRYPGRTVEIVTGASAAADTVRGQQLRLAFLGYHPGDVTGRVGPTMTAAVTEFQIDNELDPSGECDADTQAKLAASAGW